jgi:hypothetical protein
MEQELDGPGGVPVAPIRGKHVVADVDLVILQPVAVVVVVDPTNHLPPGVNTRYRARMVGSRAEPPIEVVVAAGQDEATFAGLRGADHDQPVGGTRKR